MFLLTIGAVTGQVPPASGGQRAGRQSAPAVRSSRPRRVAASPASGVSESTCCPPFNATTARSIACLSSGVIEKALALSIRMVSLAKCRRNARDADNSHPATRRINSARKRNSSFLPTDANAASIIAHLPSLRPQNQRMQRTRDAVCGCSFVSGREPLILRVMRHSPLS